MLQLSLSLNAICVLSNDVANPSWAQCTVDTRQLASPHSAPARGVLQLSLSLGAIVLNETMMGPTSIWGTVYSSHTLTRFSPFCSNKNVATELEPECHHLSNEQ